MVIAILLLVLAGAIGGVVNALITDNGFMLPKTVTTEAGTILRPGVIGNVFIGAVAAFAIWALYGPASGRSIVTLPQGNEVAASQSLLSLADLGVALVNGIGGARILTAEVDKRLLKEGAAKAAASKPNPDTAQKLRSASPAKVLEIAQTMDGK